MRQRFLGKVVRLDHKNNGAIIRPAYADEKDDTEDLFCSFKESCRLVVNMNVSFEIDHEEKSGRYAAFKVSHVLKGTLTERPSWLPSATYLDLMRSAWNRTHDKEEVESLEKEYKQSVNTNADINTSLANAGLSIRL